MFVKISHKWPFSFETSFNKHQLS